jgi:flagellar protein FlbB
MANYGATGTGLRILALLLLVAVLVVGGLLWFDFLGILDARSTLAPVRSLLGLAEQPSLAQVEDPMLLERERLQRETDALELRREALDLRESEIMQREGEIEQLTAKLELQEESLQNQEESLSDRTAAFDDRRVNLEQNSRYLVGMQPRNAVDILLQMEDPDIIELLQVTEEIAQQEGSVSLVSFWLSQMPAERAADLQRKFVRGASS